MSVRRIGKFQSTPPAREATLYPDMRLYEEIVSIHASRTGGDIKIVAEWLQEPCFNPRLPHGRRPIRLVYLRLASEFQSTPPAREATRTSRPDIDAP